VEWHISRGLIYEVGSRLVGKFGVMFLDAPLQRRSLPAQVGTDAPRHEEDTAVHLRGTFGIRKRHAGKWQPHSMLPPPGIEDLILKVQPSGGADDTRAERIDELPNSAEVKLGRLAS
jgi:hypothetical protein